jgi:hypothetical protein
MMQFLFDHVARSELTVSLEDEQDSTVRYAEPEGGEAPSIIR